MWLVALLAMAGCMAGSMFGVLLNGWLTSRERAQEHGEACAALNGLRREVKKLRKNKNTKEE